MKLVALLADAEFRAGDSEAANATIARGLQKDPANVGLLNLKVRSDSSKPKF
jgi:hypothetical protein